MPASDWFTENGLSIRLRSNFTRGHIFKRGSSSGWNMDNVGALLRVPPHKLRKLWYKHNSYKIWKKNHWYLSNFALSNIFCQYWYSPKMEKIDPLLLVSSIKIKNIRKKIKILTNTEMQLQHSNLFSSWTF